VPAAVIATTAAVIGGVAIAGAASSTDLPDKDAAELLADVHDAEPQPFSGTVVQTSRLDLPDLPGFTDTGSDLSLLSMLTGSNTARIWYTSADQFRFSLMGAFDELTVIRDHTDVWMWSSDTNEAEHLVLPEAFDLGALPTPGNLGPDKPLTPEEAAAAVLDQLDPSTAVTVDGTAEVAGRAAYELLLRPRHEQSLIDSVTLSVDADTSMILRFEITGHDSDDPAFEIGFTSVSFAEPSGDVYRFNPPEGADITEHSIVDLMAHMMGKHEGSMFSAPPTVIGEGWTSVIVVPSLDALAGDADPGILDAFRGVGEEVSGPYGSGVLFTSAIVSALWLDDGTLLVGAVTSDVLEDAAAEAAR
jgi:outer membrane lipoprotein-sorting protein